jgi:hypothetical protein
VTIAVQNLDPIAAAEAEIAGSKSLMAAVADDLSQHERWLAHYQLAEKRHARRVMLQEVIYRLDLARRRVMRFLRRVSLLGLRLARRVAAFTARTAVFVYTSIRDAVIACLDWLRPRALAFARLSRAWLVASSVWLAAQSRALAALFARASSATWVWTRVHAALAWSFVAASSRAIAAATLHWLVRTGRRASALARILWRNSLYAGRAASAWSARTARTAAASLRQNLSAAWKWTAVNGRILARASSDNARRASAWGAAHSRAAAAAIARNASSGAAWSATTAKAAARASADNARRASIWGAAHSRAAATSIARNASSGAAWSATAAKATARASADNARRASTWGAAHSRAAATSIARNVSSGAAWSATAAKAAARASIAAGRDSSSWIRLRMGAVSNATLGATATGMAQTGRALIVRQSTALICFEPKRPGFPAPRAS